MPIQKKRKGEGVPDTVHLSTETIAKGVFFVMIGILLYFLRDIVAIFLIAVLLAALIDPFATFLQKYHIARGWAVALIYSVLAVILTSVALLLVPATLQQVKELTVKYAPYIEEVSENAYVTQIVNDGVLSGDFISIAQSIQAAGLQQALPEILQLILSTFSVILTILLILILAFYLVMEDGIVRKGVMDWVVTEKHRDFILKILPKIRFKVGRWLRGQLFLMFVVWALTYAVLLLLDVPFALILSIVAGLLEIIPYLGPNIAAIPAVFIGFTASPLQGVLVALAYFAIQQLEGDVLTPKIMQKVIGLNPIVSILSIMIGFRLGGIAGALLAVPFAMVVGVFLKEWQTLRKEQAK